MNDAKRIKEIIKRKNSEEDNLLEFRLMMATGAIIDELEWLAEKGDFREFSPAIITKTWWLLNHSEDVEVFTMEAIDKELSNRGFFVMRDLDGSLIIHV